MKREIKFRTWDGEEMYYETNYVSEVGCDGYFMGVIDSKAAIQELCKDDSNYELFTLMDWELMQFTGLKDKKGNKIFEGDILEHITDKNTTIKKVVYDAQHGAFILKCDKYFQELRATYGDGDMYADTYIVIGNIHEHPDLLKRDEKSGGV